MKKTLAIFSPNENAYSETFIQAHKKLLFNTKFYFGGTLPVSLEGGRNLLDLTLLERIEKKWKRKFSLREYALLFSLKREKVDVVLTEYGETAAETLNMIQHLKLPLVVHFHGYDISVKEVLTRNCDKYRQVFHYASSVIAVSKKMVNDLFAAGCPIEKIVLNPYGPHPVFFTTHPIYTEKHFVAVGRFVDKKGPLLTILAFERISRQFPDARLTMVGDGPLKNSCQQMVNALGLGDRINFTGSLKQEQLLLLFEKSIAFVQHSITALNGDSEGTPVAILEAQAAALPVIATYHAGIPDVVIHNKTGLLVEEGDFATMSDMMKKLLTIEGFAEVLGQNGRQRVEEFFSLEQHLSIIEREIDNAKTLLKNDL